MDLEPPFSTKNNVFRQFWARNEGSGLHGRVIMDGKFQNCHQTSQGHLKNRYSSFPTQIIDLEPLFLMKNCIFRAFLALLGCLRAGQKAGSIIFVFFIIPRYPREHLHFKVSNFIDFSPNGNQFCKRRWVSQEIAILSIYQKQC